jgi:adenylate cyclase
MAMVIGALLLVAARVAWNWHSPRSGDARPAPRLSIVVLPFANLSNDPEQQYFVDAISEDVTTDLSRIAHMFVISRNTAFTYRNKQVDTKQIGRELGVRYVLEGGVLWSRNELRVTARLVDAQTDAHLSAERFDRETGDLFALQDEITRRIAAALDTSLIIAEAARPNEQPDALDYILRGRAAELNPPSSDQRANAIAMFERALAVDPRSPEAQIRLALELIGPVLNGTTASSKTDIDRAETLIGQALATWPRSLLAHFVKAEILRATYLCAEAIPEYEMVIASNRNWASAYSNLGQCKLSRGLIDETIPLQEKAIHLSPRDPAVEVWYWRIGVAHLLQSRIDEAVPWLEKACVATPAVPFLHASLAAALALEGENERAAVEFAEARRLIRDDRFSSLARLRAVVYARESVPKIRDLFERTYFAGLRKAGMPEE